MDNEPFEFFEDTLVSMTCLTHGQLNIACTYCFISPPMSLWFCPLCMKFKTRDFTPTEIDVLRTQRLVDDPTELENWLIFILLSASTGFIPLPPPVGQPIHLPPPVTTNQ